jgi:2-polyprenyl-3-methyl-5-hydroxy-6-metoxy-1,4-benzoquinol methylase
MPITELSKTTNLVRRQYEALPYPRRNPADDEKSLFVTSLDDLGAINFYCYGGRRNVQRGFRCLVAGGGTGDALMYLAHQLRATDATITYLDLSEASQQIARARARFSGMPERIIWRQGSLLDLPAMNLGEFDYINCSGVLHHLDDPQAGLESLKSVLKPDGAMGIMLYALSGRTGVYQVQDLMRLLCRDAVDPNAALHRARDVLSTLPNTNWFRRGAGLFSEQMDDAELYDMFLHPRDQAFTAAQVHDLIARAGLCFAQHSSDERALYEPQLAFNDPAVRGAIGELPLGQQQAAAELFWGAITKHSFWVTQIPNSHTDLTDSDNVPFFSRFGRRARVRETILEVAGGLWVHKIPHAGGIEVKLQLQVVPAVKRFIELIDDRRTMGEIVDAIQSEYDPVPPREDVWRTCLYVLSTLLRDDYLLLRHRSVEKFVTT